MSQVVDTMVHAPRPTRAEATDVANLVLDGTDGILLGDETSKGSNPRGAVATVAAICRQAEVCYDSQAFYARLMDEHGGFREAKLSKVCLELAPLIIFSFLSLFVRDYRRCAALVCVCGSA